MSLKNQCEMPKVTFSDFNEITHSEEELGWMEQEANQMRSFKECLSICGLFDLGFVGQRFTWCNGRLGEQRTLIRLDRMLANERWMEQLHEAQVHHISMSTSDHCLLALFLWRKKPTKPVRRRFFFEAMWARDERCREVIELAWDPLQASMNFNIVEKIKSCQFHLQRWNKKVFGNVNIRLKHLRECLRHLEAQNLLHETVGEIQE